jgi:uncharacterized protein YggE
MVKENVLGWVAIALLAVVMLAGFYFISTQIKAPEVSVSTYPETKAILATGQSTTKVAPDLLIINLGVETKNKTAADSQSTNAALMSAVKSAIKGEGLTDEDIKTSYFTVQVVQEKINGTYVITGYKTIHMLSLNIEDTTKGGAILDAASKAGANKINSVYFTLKSTTRRSLEEQQLALAAQDAKTRAQKIASGLGVTAGKAKQASESVTYYPYQTKAAYEAISAPSVSGTDLSSGEIEVRATVSASFEIQ